MINTVLFSISFLYIFRHTSMQEAPLLLCGAGKGAGGANGAITRSGEPLVREEERGVFQGETLKCSLSS